MGPDLGYALNTSVCYRVMSVVICAVYAYMANTCHVFTCTTDK